jgi:hypothetical protein
MLKVTHDVPWLPLDGSTIDSMRTDVEVSLNQGRTWHVYSTDPLLRGTSDITVTAPNVTGPNQPIFRVHFTYRTAACDGFTLQQID